MNLASGKTFRWSALVLALLAVYVLWPSEEERIKKRLRNLAEALEQRNVDEIMNHLSFNYSDNHGASYLLVRKQLERRLPEYSEVRVEMEPPSIIVSENTAQVRTGLRVSAVHGYDMGYFVGDFDNPAPVALTMEKHPPGKWLVLKATYEYR